MDMTNLKSMRIGCAALSLALLVTASGHAWGVSHENNLTFSRPVALPGVVLPAGSYTFDLAGSTSSLDIVVVRDKASSKVYYMGFTNTVKRPASMSKTAAITFGEASANQPPPIATWYEIGDSLGHQFLYR
jgi:hypothetical protein